MTERPRTAADWASYLPSRLAAWRIDVASAADLLPTIGYSGFPSLESLVESAALELGLFLDCPPPPGPATDAYVAGVTALYAAGVAWRDRAKRGDVASGAPALMAAARALADLATAPAPAGT